MAFDRNDVELIDDTLVYDGFFKVRSVSLRHRLFEGGWSEPLNREIFMRHDAVAVLLYDPALDQVALVEQFRIGAMAGQRSPWLLELVAGLIDQDESPQAVARRESLEEADCEVQQLEPICEYFSSPGGSKEYLYLYCGKADLSTAGGVHGLEHEGEDIRVHVLGYEQCWQLLQRGELNNAHTIIAVQWLAMNRERLREQWL